MFRAGIARRLGWQQYDHLGLEQHVHDHQAYTQVETGTNDTESGLPAITSTIILDGAGSTIERSSGLGTRCAGGGAKFRIFY
jgi:hypothetical protein